MDTARFAAGGTLHQGHDLGKAGVSCDLLHLHVHRGAEVVAATQHAVSGPAGARFRFAIEQRLVHLRRAAQQHAVGGKCFTRVHPQRVPRRHAARGHALETAVCALALDAVGQAVHQRFQRTRGAVAQAQLQKPPREQEEDKHGEGVEIDLSSKHTMGVEGAGAADGKGNAHAERHR